MSNGTVLADPVFVVGCPRSGTTLLGVLLDRHSSVSITPETAFYDEIAPALAASPSSLPSLLNSWPRLAELELTAERVVERCGLRPARAQVLRALLELHAERGGKARCGEKTPQHLSHVPQILDDFPRARIFCVVRDGREVALSLSTMPWWRHGLVAAAHAWVETVRLAEMFVAHHSEQFTVVRYEHLVTRPTATLERIMRCIDLALELRQFDPGESRVVLPRSRAWKARALTAIDSRCATHRQRIASAAEIATLDALLGPTLERLDYPGARSNDDGMG